MNDIQPWSYLTDRRGAFVTLRKEDWERVQLDQQRLRHAVRILAAHHCEGGCEVERFLEER